VTTSPIFAVQYLESPYRDVTPISARKRLRRAFERLPISLVLLGWELPLSLEEAVAEEAEYQHAQLFRWQPILTSDAHTSLPSEWATKGPSGNTINGHAGLPEFTFICPNNNAVADFISERVEIAAATGLFQGLFLDRIRFPSPSIDPFRDLACFCRHCTRVAADIELDLEYVRRYIQSLPVETIVRCLLGKTAEAGSPLDSLLNFRASSITRTVRMISKQAQTLKLSIGLDCFSPALTRMVGQDLSDLGGLAGWVKIMTYPRVFGPAGIPFELLNFINWLTRYGMGENEAIQLLAEASGLPLPANKTDLRRAGLESKMITQEIQHGKELGLTNLLAGIAMVNMKSVHTSSSEKIQADLEACKNSDGLVISWDLWLTPLDYLDKVRILWS
jgi:hypothetical protein